MLKNFILNKFIINGKNGEGVNTKQHQLANHSVYIYIFVKVLTSMVIMVALLLLKYKYK